VRPHPDVDLLALHALGEPVLDPAAHTHVADCGRCRTTVEELTATVDTVRGPAAHAPVDVAPVPAHVWQGIADELGLDPAVRPASVGPSSVRHAHPAPTGRVPLPSGPAREHEQPTATPRPGPAPGRDRSDHLTGVPDIAALTARTPRGRAGRRGTGRLLAVAAAGVVVGAAGTALVTGLAGLGGTDGSDAEPQLLAAADLEAFGAGEGTAVAGSARLATTGQDDPDERVLQVWLDGLPDTGDDFLEAWLIDPETGAMVSLGPVDAPAAGAVTVELSVPRGLDVGTYALVDVSAEPLDGDPTHSGASLARGTLGTLGT
jgi:hypothetical protein